MPSDRQQELVRDKAGKLDIRPLTPRIGAEVRGETPVSVDGQPGGRVLDY